MLAAVVVLGVVFGISGGLVGDMDICGLVSKVGDGGLGGIYGGNASTLRVKFGSLVVELGRFCIFK